MSTHTDVPVEIEPPHAPEISVADVWAQFCTDIQGKDVQMTATWSYTWTADQVGHVCIGLVLYSILCGVLGLIQATASFSEWISAVAAAILVALWEIRAYRMTVQRTTDRFPLDVRDLRDNAVIATVYMIFGILLAFGFRQEFGIALVFLLLFVVAAAWLAVPWLRQKITWQKVGLPFLFRLADARPNISPEDAHCVQEFLEQGAPPDVPPRQVIIHGAIGTGRTSLGVGIATETAFRKRKARYVSMDKLLEMAILDKEYSGPWNVRYWPWRESQLIVIDDVSPDVKSDEDQDFDIFEAHMTGPMKKAYPVLQTRDTVWIIGESEDTARWKNVIAKVCKSQHEPIVVGLNH